MNETVRFATFGIVICLGAAACSPATAGSRSPSATPTVAATFSPSANQALTATFKSPMMGYSVKYPAGWKVTPATARWPPGAINYWDSPELDKLDGKSAEFRGSSQALATGQSTAQWVSAYLASAGANCGTQEHVSVGDQIGLIDGNDCAFDTSHGGYPGRLYDLVVVAGGRGYNFAMEGQVDHAFFLAMLATITLTP